MRLLPASLGGQLLALLLAALLGAQAVSFLVYADERADAVWRADRVGLLQGAATVLRMLEQVPPAQRPALAEAAGSPRIRFWTSADSAVAAAEASPVRRPLALQFARMFGSALREPPRIAFIDREEGDPPRRGEGWRDGSPRDEGRWDGGRWHEGWVPWREARADLIASVPLQDGGWLNAQTRIRAERVSWAWTAAVPTAVMALAILLIVGFTTRRATRPLRALVESADALGRGSAVPPLPERGPEEVRRLTAAFNEMQDRLGRFVADRTRMLAAMGHDLRTPITALRLRVELLEEEEARVKMSGILDEMERMAEATLAFARADATPEETRSVDLEALLASLVDDLAAMGEPVRFQEGERLPYRCRPAALKRALTNLILNAVRYGGRADIALRGTPEGPLITIEDEGPGIPEDRLEDVFKPFVRLETSRSRETGGAGLGLAIARSVILAHGGRLVLANRAAGGLRAEVHLPPV